MLVIDTRGLSCPQPVLMVHPHLNDDQGFDVLVDNDASRENVSRAARHAGWTVGSRPGPDGVTRLEVRR